MNWIQKFRNKNIILKFILSYYGIIFIIFVIWIIFLDDYSYTEHRILDKKIKELEDNKKYFISEIKKDSIENKNLKNPMKKEQFAREKYYMKKPNEDIYIIEYRDSIKQ
ncbi:MAG: septum formation initiator family protein [Flavobacterium sp.]|jgi:cell division protein FtsB